MSAYSASLPLDPIHRAKAFGYEQSIRERVELIVRRVRRMFEVVSAPVTVTH
jgi:hypothetical protein